MEVRTFRAPTMQEALSLVRRELGPDAAVLHTREVRAGRLLGWLPGRGQIEVTASTQVAVPSRLPQRRQPAADGLQGPHFQNLQPPAPPRDETISSPPAANEAMQGRLDQLQAMVEDLCRRTHQSPGHEWPQQLFDLYTDLIEAEIAEELARELIEGLRRDFPADQVVDPVLAKAHLASMIESEINVSGPISVEPGQRRVVALVGPTGVGKTTTIAKLAANFRLRDKRRVGLITVDTYRIAAVDQLRTYAEIIDLPMQVVSTPREMRGALAQFEDQDLVLIDTAGRSPRDEVKLQELKVFLAEAQADQVHLVLSSVNSGTSLSRTASQFSAVGTTALLFTKLDEASGLGNLLPVIRSTHLPISYVTNGQNVPDDIEAAVAGNLASEMLGIADPKA